MVTTGYPSSVKNGKVNSFLKFCFETHFWPKQQRKPANYHYSKTFCVRNYAMLCLKRQVILTTKMGFEPTRAEHIGLAVQRLNHSATSSDISF